jgi:hypothetical protein
MSYSNKGSSSSFAFWDQGNSQKSFSSYSASANNTTNDSNNDSSVWSQLTSIQDSFVGQMQELSGMLPDAGPLSSAFRARLINAVYLLGGSVGFGILAIFIGLPTLLVRPSKFVICISLSTLLAAASVIVLQKPSVFISNLLSGGFTQSAPVALLIISMLFTLYITIFVHRYAMVLAAGSAQLLCLLFYLASFIPGGMTGLQMVLRMAWAVFMTTMKPCFYITKQTAMALFRSICSS